MNNIMYGESPLGFRYQGRNGMGKQEGLSLSVTRNAVELGPINSKGLIANCFVQVPFDKIDEVIEGIKKVKDDLRERCPACRSRNILCNQTSESGAALKCRDSGEIWSLNNGTTKAKLEISSRWECPKCGTEICGIGFGDVAEVGNPICGECGEDMDFAGEDILLAGTREVLYQN